MPPKTKPKPKTDPVAKPQLPVERTDYSADWWNPQGLVEAREMAAEYAASDLVPKEYRNKAGNVLVAWSLGAPLGLSVLSSLTHIAVINGKPSIYGDAAAAIVRAHPLCVKFHEPQVTGEGDDMEAVCMIQRGTEEPVIRSFSVADAKQAKLWGREGPWRNYPKRMLQMRARSWAMRDAFPDALCGMPIYEEVRDITPDVTVKDAPPEGKDSTDRLKNKLKPKPKVEVVEEEVTPEEVEELQEGGPEPDPDAEPEKTVEDYILEAENSEDLNRLMAEINHRHDEKQIDTKRWGDLTQMVQDRSKEIATGKKGKKK